MLNFFVHNEYHHDGHCIAAFAMEVFQFIFTWDIAKLHRCVDVGISASFWEIVYFLAHSLLALLDSVSRANAVARASVRPSSVVRPSVKRVVSETVKQINAKFCGKVSIHHISRPFFPFLKILDF